ncbi:MAG: hypothetical protein ACPGSO_03580 [Vicingaceae bacterium]
MYRYIIFILISFFSITATAQKENSPELKEIYFTNKVGEKITGTVKVEEKIVYMVIESANAIGQKVVITMDEDENYFYKNNFLSGGSSFKIKIKENTQKIKLEIYNPRINKHIRRRKKIEGYKEAQDAKE